MSAESKLSTTKTLAMVLLFATDFLLFYQTAIGGTFAKGIANVLILLIPALKTVTQLIPYLLFGLFAVFMSIVYIATKKNRALLFGLISFLLFLPAAASAQTINWTQNTGIFNLPFFFLTVTGGIVILSCLLFLNHATKLSETKRELLARGANNTEVDAVIESGLSFTLIAIVASVAITVAGVLFYVGAQPLGNQIATNTLSYLPFVVGVVAVATIAALMIMYFGKHVPTKQPN
jgi:hypothetical protein